MKFAALFIALLPLACGGSHPQEHHQHQGPIGHRFEKAEDWVPVFEGPERDRWQKPAEVVTIIGLGESMTVVDLGAGTGYFMPYLARAVGPKGKVIALDVEADMVRYLSERATRDGLGNVEARRVPFDDPQLHPGSADRILIVDTWHHIPDRAAYCARLASALAPGGSIWVIDFTRDSDIGPPVHERIAPEAVAAELAGAGLAAEVIPAAAEPFAKQYVVVARRK